MNDLPFFTAPDGMASLILREIPRQGTAYVVVRCVFGSQEGLLRDCDSFCRSAGAIEILYSGNADFSGFSVAACLTERALPRECLPETAAAAVETKDSRWAELYNECFAAVPAARTYNAVPEGAYFVYDGKTLIGLGQVCGDEIAAVASLQKGRGRDCLCRACLRRGLRQAHVAGRLPPGLRLTADYPVTRRRGITNKREAPAPGKTRVRAL